MNMIAQLAMAEFSPALKVAKVLGGLIARFVSLSFNFRCEQLSHDI